MQLHHFLYGKDPATDDFLTLVSSSNVSQPELKYWEARVGALIREFRDYGVPGDFMRLLVSGKRAGEWAYVRARTGGDRSRFDFQAVMLNSEELARLGWRPWALDGVLFSGNTNDRRVQDALNRDAAQAGHEYNQRIVDISFDGGEAEPCRLTEMEEEMVGRLAAGLGDAGAPETRWYFDEGQVGEETGRQIVATVLGRLYGLNLDVPGFVMGITSVRENGSAFSLPHQNDERFSDIRLASYKKGTDGTFPFDNWRDAGAGQSPAIFNEGPPQSRPSAPSGRAGWGQPRTGDEESAAPASWAGGGRSRLDESHAPSFNGAGPDGPADASRSSRWSYGSGQSNYAADASADGSLSERLGAGLKWLEQPVSLKHVLPAAGLLLILSNVLTYSFARRVSPAAVEPTTVGASVNAQAVTERNREALSGPGGAEKSPGKGDPDREAQNVAAAERAAAVTVTHDSDSTLYDNLVALKNDNYALKTENTTLKVERDRCVDSLDEADRKLRVANRQASRVSAPAPAHAPAPGGTPPPPAQPNNSQGGPPPVQKREPPPPGTAPGAGPS